MFIKPWNIVKISSLLLVNLILLIACNTNLKIFPILVTDITPKQTTSNHSTTSFPSPTYQPFTKTPQPTQKTNGQTTKSQVLKIGHSRVREIDDAIEIFIPEGEFMMGCDENHNGGFNCNIDELPLHAVFLSSYFIDKYEITNAQYAKCVDVGVCNHIIYKYSQTRNFYFGNSTYNNYPLINVSWYEADTYCKWVGGRLPTEAEWEKAARGTSVKAFPWGDSTPSCKLANSYNNETGKPCVGDTMPVGSYPAGASQYGVMDLAGNVWEWVNDWYSYSYYSISPYYNPTGVDKGTHKVVRGGAWDYSWEKLRLAYNSDHNPSTRYVSFGFRCVNPTLD